ncbi:MULTISPECIES: pirin family protein [Sphingomonas]|uniref:pirin family protein n=1 Tax=Sphingomonas TaxID=13687 RepID=UPI0006FEF31A|nr:MULTISPECIES: pirin family protein [Sphingomonas]KQM92904.1 nuclease PIN [Sphingomonas sp. Leaf226]MDY0967406.1 pirin family protein [Sphingomonas sp. CFBP9021]USR01073.1 pirin family protein [Sphingomonas aerolata]
MRRVLRTYPAQRDDIADLVTRRPLPGPQLPQVDPFLFVNHHGPQTYRPGNNGLPFGPHPHRGFETVSFILSGAMAHLDSGGHESVMQAGGVQWMTAGSGLIHAEVSPASFKRDGGPLEILQLWVNLPGRLKMTKPAYTGLQREDIPAVAVDGGVVNVIAGTFEGQAGPVESLTGVAMMTVELAAGRRVTLPAPQGRSVFFYVIEGRPEVSGTVVEPWHLVTFDEDGDTIEVAAAGPVRLVFGHADPIDEPVVAHGPFVMTTREEIGEAIRDYQAGLFGAAPVIA